MKVAVVNTGPGVTWPDRDRVDELRLREPVQALDEIGAQEREQDVAAAEQDRADLEEHPEEPGRLTAERPAAAAAPGSKGRTTRTGAAPGPPRASQGRDQRRPRRTGSASSFAPSSDAASAAAPTIARAASVRAAAGARFHSACATIARITGFTP